MSTTGYDVMYGKKALMLYVNSKDSYAICE